MTIDTIILLANFASTLFMVGLIWFVQIVHYPLFNGVGTEGYPEYQARHSRRTTWVVGPPMLIEAFTSVLLIWFQPIGNTALLLLGVAMLFVIWAVTVLFSIPCHSQLERGFNENAYRQLVSTNWLRTLFWTMRGVLMGWVLIQKIALAAV